MRKIETDIYYTALSEALNYDDMDAYISDMALSSIWEDPEGVDAPVPKGRIIWLERVWKAVHRTAKDVADDAHLSYRALARRFMIPYGTVNKWCLGENVCSLHTLIMMQECLGLVSPVPGPTAWYRPDPE